MVKLLEGMDEHPQSKGRMCVKGLSGRQFAYREDRIPDPLKRVGERGEGKNLNRSPGNRPYDEIASPVKWDQGRIRSRCSGVFRRLQ